jgi:glycosyltransferase involved in cell wall biosynthesis
MHVVYPYNEILPKKKAHDLFVCHECAALAEYGWQVSWLIGRGSSSTLLTHYNIPPTERLNIFPLFIIRKNNPLNLSWNFPFFCLCQRFIQQSRPNAVILSVRKQGAYHLQRKIPNVRYVYEVHELAYYPNQTHLRAEFQSEKEMLMRADLITVTTEALKTILLAPPYSLHTPVIVVPLAVRAKPLAPPPLSSGPLQLAYVGQLYGAQGLPILFQALTTTPHVRLKILGGTPIEIAALQELAQKLGIKEAISFLGFVPPSQISHALQEVHAFVAPFDNTGRMPYVAHTKLYEYAEWGRPILAPHLPSVYEHFPKGFGAILFEPADPASLSSAIRLLERKAVRLQLQNEIETHAGRFGWPARAKQYTELLKVSE